MLRRNAGWFPQQHGAWAMLSVPLVVGLVLRGAAGRNLGAGQLTLSLFWFVGYFAFNAASLWLKAAPARRRGLARPVLTYAAAAAALGLGTLLLVGPQLAGWAPAFLPLLVPALALAWSRHERATVGGALTTAAASLMVLVASFDSPTELAAWTPAVRSAVATASLVFAYFFGTVLYVKTNIRQRGSRRFYVASVAWHGAATLAAAALAALGPLGTSPAWAVLFALATARAAAVPRLRRPLTPKQVGLAEVAFCAAILAIVGLA